jgi:hypothetical protein
LYAEFHCIINVPFSCLNRDRHGNPKHTEFGGVKRSRVSSQCFNHALRKSLMDEFSAHFGVQTAYLGKLVAEACGKVPELADKSSAIGQRFSAMFAIKDDGKTQVLRDDASHPAKWAETLLKYKTDHPNQFDLWMDKAAIVKVMVKDTIIRFDNLLDDSSDIVKKWDNFTKKKCVKQITKAPNNTQDGVVEILSALNDKWNSELSTHLGLTKQDDDKKSGNSNDHFLAYAKKECPDLFTDTSLDTALMGRFIAQPDFKDVEGAWTQGHWIGLTEMMPVRDFFTTWDDYTKRSEHMLEDKLVRDFVSTAYYSYSVLDITKLVANSPALLDNNRALLCKFLGVLYRKMYGLMPGAMSRKTATNVPPVGILVQVIRDAQPFNLCSAYDEVLVSQGRGLNRQAVQKLNQQVAAYSTEYEPGQVKRIWLSHEFSHDFTVPDTDLVGNSRDGAVRFVEAVKEMLA